MSAINFFTNVSNVKAVIVNRTDYFFSIISDAKSFLIIIYTYFSTLNDCNIRTNVSLQYKSSTL